MESDNDEFMNSVALENNSTQDDDVRVHQCSIISNDRPAMQT